MFLGFVVAFSMVALNRACKSQDLTRFTVATRVEWKTILAHTLRTIWLASFNFCIPEVCERLKFIYSNLYMIYNFKFSTKTRLCRMGPNAHSQINRINTG